ncbi:MAG: DUF4093 domain-containing protein [Clostridia bacterium]|nr:DUF4093 domain-containing protein [Clostridia bacterium]
MIHIQEVIVVEGKYDKERLRKLTDAPIICTHGFQLYRSKAIVSSIRNMAKKRGVLILTDSDQAGFRIRNYLKSCLGQDCPVKNLYIPAMKGKEKRKEKPGKEGLLGVEGMDDATLTALLFSAAGAEESHVTYTPATKADFFAAGLSGKDDSTEKRAKLARHLNLPPRMSANAMLELINQIGGKELLEKSLGELK